jgi:urease accessory protein
LPRDAVGPCARKDGDEFAGEMAMPTLSPVRDYVRRAYTVSVSGSSDSGKTALLLALSRLLRDNYSIAVVTRRQAPDQDGSREFLLRHKALAASRIVAVDEDSQLGLAIEFLMTECRPELIFVDEDSSGWDTDAQPDFTIHVVNGSGAGISPDDAVGAARSDLLVLNQTHLGAPLDLEQDVSVRDSLRARGDAPFVVAHLRYGIGTIEIARQLLGSWRRTSAPAAWAMPLDAHVLLAPA